VGRLLLLITLIAAGAIFYYLVMFLHSDMPDGRYPVAFLLIPVLIGAGIFFMIVSLILKACRVPVWREDSDADQPPPKWPDQEEFMHRKIAERKGK